MSAITVCSSLEDAALHLVEAATESPQRMSLATFQLKGEHSLLHIHYNDPGRFREIECELKRQLESILGYPPRLLGWNWKLGCTVSDARLSFSLQLFVRIK